MSAARTIGRFEVLEALGDGSFGSILEGRDPSDGAKVQIQLCTLEDAELRRRFHAEATAIAKLRHPHLVEVRGVGFEGEIPFLVEESLPHHLGQILEKRPPWSAGEKLALLQQVARGVAFGHSRGLHHLELRPDQVKLANVEGRHVAKVAGFGIARLANSASGASRKGVTLETAVYLPPEQVRGGEVDHRVDLFALGVIAYELLTYERPFRGQNLSALVYQVLYKEPQAMAASWPDCPSSLEELLGRCLAKKPEDRFDSVETLLTEIDTFLRQAHGRWAGLEKPYQAMPSVTRDVSDTEVTRSQLARTAQDLGPRGSEGAATVRLQVAPGTVEEFGTGLEATQSLPALGDEVPAGEGEASASEKPGESTITLPSPPEAIPPAELAGAGAPPPPPPPSQGEAQSVVSPQPSAPEATGTKKSGVDTRPVGRKTVRLDAIPVVTPNRPVPPSAPPQAPPPSDLAASASRSADEMPTVVTSSDELPTVLSSQPLADLAVPPSEPPEEPTLVTSPELPTSSELPTVLSSQPLAGMAEPPAELPSEPPEEPTLVTTSDELPTVLSTAPPASPPSDEPAREPTLVVPVVPDPPSAASGMASAEGAAGPEPTLVVPTVGDSGATASPVMGPGGSQESAAPPSIPPPPGVPAQAAPLGGAPAAPTAPAPSMPPQTSTPTPAAAAPAFPSSTPSAAFAAPPLGTPEPVAEAGSTGAPSPVAFDGATVPQGPGGMVLNQGPQAPTQPAQPASKGSSKWIWIALAGIAFFGMLALAGLAWWFFGRGTDKATDDTAPVATAPVPAPPVAADTPLGQVVVLAAPWGRLVEITDAAGFVRDLPAEPFTPLSLALPPGRYRITLQYGDEAGLPLAVDGPETSSDSLDSGAGDAGPGDAVASGEPAVCEVEVRLDTVARCQVRFEAPSATDYFKEAGWWQ